MAFRLHFAEEALDAAVVEQLAGLWSEAVVGQDEGETKETMANPPSQAREGLIPSLAGCISSRQTEDAQKS